MKVIPYSNNVPILSTHHLKHPPKYIIEVVPIVQFKYTHDFAMDICRHGAHAGLHVHAIVDRLVRGGAEAIH